MSWWTNIRDTAEHIGTLGLYNPKESRRAEADQRYAINDQIKSYKDQTELTRNELARNRDEQVAEKRKINEKQIRSLRRNYRPAGFLNNQAGESVAGTTQNLGG